MGELVEFPRKLEWAPVEVWSGTVPGTALTAKVEKSLKGEVFAWAAWVGPALIAAGTASDLAAGKEAARTALETTTLVVREIPLTAK